MKPTRRSERPAGSAWPTKSRSASAGSAADEAAGVIERMKEHGFLISTDGPLHNVLKIKPPLVLQADDIDHLLTTLDEVL